MDISELRREDEKAWDKYVYNSNTSTFYHQIGWKNVVEKTYKHKPIYLIAKEEGEIKGVLPLFLMKSMFFGKKLVSVPFAPYGGVCADNRLIENALIDEAKKITKECSADYLELRHLYKTGSEFVTNDTYFTLILKLNKDPNVLWENFRKSMRRYIRKAVKNHLEVSLGPDNLKEFYNIYTINMRDLGTPVHRYSFFENVIHEFLGNANIATVKYKDNSIAALFLLYFKDTITYGWGSSLGKYLDLNPNYLIFWELIRYACERNYNFFDFGRSQKSEGTFLFKTGWGAEPEQLCYQYYLCNKRNMPDTGQSNPKRQSFAKVWRKFPLYLTNKSGPILRRNIP